MGRPYGYGGRGGYGPGSWDEGWYSRPGRFSRDNWSRDSDWWQSSGGKGAAKGASAASAGVRGEAWADQTPSGGGSASSETSLRDTLSAVEKASEPTEAVMHRAGVALEHTLISRQEVEAVLGRLLGWLCEDAQNDMSGKSKSKAPTMFMEAGLPIAIVRVMRKFRDETPVVALACLVMHWAAQGNPDTAYACVRAGGLDEMLTLMDQHKSHGGIQNVCLLVLGDLLKDNSVARQAVSLGFLSRVVHALEKSSGREVQYNGCNAVKLLADLGRAPRAGLQEVLMQAKAHHEHDVMLTTMADDALSVVTPRFKEVLCWHFQSGWCRLGPRCTYAHGHDDLRKGNQPPGQSAQLLAMAEATPMPA